MTLAGAVIALLLAALAVSTTTGRVIAKAVADPLIHSTSAGAALFALLFLAVSLLRMHIPAGRAPAAPPSRRAAWLLVAALVAGNAANLAGHLALLESMDLPARVSLYVWNGADNTYSYVFHSHAGKAAIATLLAPLAGPLGLDVGQAWGGLIPPAVGLVVGAAFVIALVVYLWLLPTVARTTGSGWLTLLFGLATLDALKTVIDGGLLTYRCLPALLVVAALVGSRDPAPLRDRAARLVALVAGATLAYAMLWQALSPAGSREPLQSFVLVLLSLAVPALGAWRGFNPRPLRRAAFAAAATALAGLWAIDSGTTLHALYAPLPRGAAALRIDPTTLAASPVEVRGRNAAQVYATTGDDPLKPRTTLLLGPTPATTPAQFPLLVIAGRGGASRPVNRPPWALQPARAPTARPDARLIVLSAAPAPLPRAFAVAPFLQQNNYYVLLHGVAAQLRAGGLASFTLVPLRDTADFDALRGT